MSTPRNLWFALAVLGLAGAAFLALGRGPADRPFDEPTGNAATGDPDPPAGAAATRVVDDVASARPEDVERRELELARDLGLVDSAAALDARATLTMRGRVVDSRRRPVAGATVEPRVRRSPRAIFEGGGPPPGFDTDFREMFRDRALAKAVVTGDDGSFAFDGEAFALGSSVELAIEHEAFAPAVVQREWTADVGAVVLPDVVLGDGARVTGFVVGPTGNPVPGAVVAFDQPGFGRGRGGRGGRGPGGGRFGGFGADRLGELVGKATADAQGRFELRHVPTGEFVLTATAPRHVDGRTEPVAAEDGRDLDVGEIRLGPGAELSGFVIDADGAPVADAEVSAAFSRAASRDDPDAEDPGGRARGRGPDAFGPGGFGNPGTTTRTDAEGRFALDRVPQAPLRVLARHPRFVEQAVDPVDPRVQSTVRIQLQPRPFLSGVVVDAATGQAVESFGIRARTAREFGPGRGGWGGLGGARQRMADTDPELAARLAEMEARAEREEEWRRRFVGESGRVPERTPAPSAHPGGRFRLEGVEPGDNVVDVDAPGYVRVAAGPFVVAPGQPAEGLVIRMERGIAVAGRVLDGRTGQAVPGARVSVSIPPLPDSGVQPDPLGMFGRFGGGRGGRGRGPRDVLAEARTDRTGRFELAALRAGTYALAVEARDYPGLLDPAFDVTAGREVVDLRLDPGARIHGVVTGVDAARSAQLEFLHVETNARRIADVSAEDGTYEVQGMQSGAYFVQVVEPQDAGPGGDPRRRLGAALAARAGAAPDLVVEPGADVRFDVDAQALDLATVRGRVFRNGAPGGGLEVRLVAQVDAAGVDPAAGRFATGRLAQLFSGRVSDEDGTFAVESVPPGDYLLEVRRRGGGGRGGARGGPPQLNLGGSALHSEPVTLRKGQTAERLIEVSTGAIELTVKDVEGQPVARARVTLVLAADVGDAPPDAWGEAPSLLRAGVRDGVYASDAVAPGLYRVWIEAPGFQPATGTVQVLRGSEPARAEWKLQADAPAPTGGNGR